MCPVIVRRMCVPDLARRFKLRISAILWQNFADNFLDTAGSHHSVSGPRHIEPDRRISRISAHREGVFHRGYASVQLGHAFAR